MGAHGRTWAHTGRGSFHHVAGQAFLDALELDAVDVPFASGGPTRTAVMGGEVDFGFIGVQQRAGFEDEINALALVSDSPPASGKFSHVGAGGCRVKTGGGALLMAARRGRNQAMRSLIFKARR